MPSRGIRRQCPGSAELPPDRRTTRLSDQDLLSVVSEPNPVMNPPSLTRRARIQRGTQAAGPLEHDGCRTSAGHHVHHW
jgi:hypothetical protein